MNSQYYNLLKKLWEYPDCESAPRDIKTKELLGVSFMLPDPRRNIVTIPGFETNIKYAMKELEWYLSGSNKIIDLGEFEHCWKPFSDDGKYVNSAYGHRIFGKHPKIKTNQWEWCFNKLREDKDSRQCVINLNAEFDKHKKTKDFVCTVFVQMMLRHNRLHWFTCMRSSDIYLGLRNDVFCFAAMQQLMASLLRSRVGHYYHYTSSLHLYEKQFPKVRKLMKGTATRDFPDKYHNIQWPLLQKYIDKLPKVKG